MLSSLIRSSLLSKFIAPIHNTTSYLTYNRIQSTSRIGKRFILPVVWSSAYLYYVNKEKIKCNEKTDEQVSKWQTRRDNMKLETLV